MDESEKLSRLGEKFFPNLKRANPEYELLFVSP